MKYNTPHIGNAIGANSFGKSFEPTKLLTAKSSSTSFLRKNKKILFHRNTFRKQDYCKNFTQAKLSILKNIKKGLFHI